MKKKILFICIIILCMVFIYLQRIPFPKQGSFLLYNDPNSNCLLVIDKYKYHFEGHGPLYDDVIIAFKKSGEIKKIINYRGYLDIYLITNDSNGPYISFSEDDIVSFNRGTSFSDRYDFYEIEE